MFQNYLTMKSFILLASLGLSSIALSCNNDKAVREEAERSLGQPGVQAPASPTTPNPAAATAAAPSGVAHYICPNNCAGSGGDATGTCPTCGTTYIHNQAYHDQASPQISTQVPPTPTPQTTEPAQNAAGVWHYTCSKGCAGGAGTAIACASCGQMLAHNAAYHN